MQSVPSSGVGPASAVHTPGTSLRKRRSLPASIVGPLALVLVVTVVLLAASEWVFHANNGALARMQAAALVEHLTQELRGALLDAETGQRGYLLTGDGAYLIPFEDAERRLPDLLAQLHRAVKHDRELRDLATSLDAPAEGKVAELRSTLRLARDGKRGQAMEIVRAGEGVRLMAELRERLQKIHGIAVGRAQAAGIARERHTLLARGAILTLMLVAAVLIVVALRMMFAYAQRREVLRAEEQRRTRELETLVAERTRDLSALSTELQTAVERERSTLAKELHDELGGLLTAAKMDMAWLTSHLGHTLDPAGAEKFSSVVQMLHQAMSMNRRVVENLRPSLLDHFGLAVALRSHFEEHCSRAGLECVVTLPEEALELEHATQLTLFRVAQEALANILTRSKAKHVELVVESGGGGYQLLVGDDGVPMDLQLTRSMVVIRHRVESALGKLEAESVPGQGNRIRAYVPRSPAR